MNFAYIWPLALVVASNVLYQLCTKSVPDEMHPLASLVLTYLVGAAVSAGLYFVISPEPHLLRELGKTNWAPLVLGIVIVGLEVGYIYAYKAGWPVSTAAIVQAAVLSVLLVGVGKLLYQEPITWHKLVGVGLCLAGLVFLNWKTA